MATKEQLSPVNIELKEQAKDQPGGILPNMIHRVSVNIGGREIPLKYDMRVQIQIESEMDMDCNELMDQLRKSRKISGVVIHALRILGNEGLKAAGEDADLTEDWLLENIPPLYIKAHRAALMAAITASWFMETDSSSEGERDLGLEEIRKKKESTD